VRGRGRRGGPGGHAEKVRESAGQGRAASPRPPPSTATHTRRPLDDRSLRGTLYGRRVARRPRSGFHVVSLRLRAEPGARARYDFVRRHNRSSSGAPEEERKRSDVPGALYLDPPTVSPLRRFCYITLHDMALRVRTPIV